MLLANAHCYILGVEILLHQQANRNSLVFIQTSRVFLLKYRFKYKINNPFAAFVRFLGIDLQQLACTYGNPTCISAARDEYNRFIDGTEE